MAVQISVRDNIREVSGYLGSLGRVAEISGQRAAVQTARLVLAEERKEMADVFDRPTAWTLNALRVDTPRGGQAIYAAVQTKDGYWYRADNYLETQIEGGARKYKAFENALRRRGLLPSGWYVVPGQAAKMTAFGNQAPSEIRQVLSWFSAAEMVSGSTQNMTDATRNRRRRGTRRTRGFEYFLVYPDGLGPRGRAQSLTPGIYRRTFFGFGGAIKPVMIFVKRVQYRPRFDFYGVARRVIDANYSRLFSADFNRRKYSRA